MTNSSRGPTPSNGPTPNHSARGSYLPQHAITGVSDTVGVSDSDNHNPQNSNFVKQVSFNNGPPSVLQSSRGQSTPFAMNPKVTTPTSASPPSPPHSSSRNNNSDSHSNMSARGYGAGVSGVPPKSKYSNGPAGVMKLDLPHQGQNGSRSGSARGSDAGHGSARSDQQSQSLREREMRYIKEQKEHQNAIDSAQVSARRDDRGPTPRSNFVSTGASIVDGHSLSQRELETLHRQQQLQKQLEQQYSNRSAGDRLLNAGRGGIVTTAGNGDISNLRDPPPGYYRGNEEYHQPVMSQNMSNSGSVQGSARGNGGPGSVQGSARGNGGPGSVQGSARGMQGSARGPQPSPGTGSNYQQGSARGSQNSARGGPTGSAQGSARGQPSSARDAEMAGQQSQTPHDHDDASHGPGTMPPHYIEPPSYHESRYLAYRSRVRNIAGSQLRAPFASDYIQDPSDLDPHNNSNVNLPPSWAIQYPAPSYLEPVGGRGQRPLPTAANALNKCENYLQLKEVAQHCQMRDRYGSNFFSWQQ